ncbi:transcription factor TFIIIC subunit tfc4 [Blastocladiella emersonii ATCC 22665]|nr:transcription factor TFIIIC subunit tfc4 [Blastocladiella emersonii ATCC 22665]
MAPTTRRSTRGAAAKAAAAVSAAVAATAAPSSPPPAQRHRAQLGMEWSDSEEPPPTAEAASASRARRHGDSDMEFDDDDDTDGEYRDLNDVDEEDMEVDPAPTAAPGPAPKLKAKHKLNPPHPPQNYLQQQQRLSGMPYHGYLPPIDPIQQELEASLFGLAMSDSDDDDVIAQDAAEFAAFNEEHDAAMAAAFLDPTSAAAAAAAASDPAAWILGADAGFATRLHQQPPGSTMAPIGGGYPGGFVPPSTDGPEGDLDAHYNFANPDLRRLIFPGTMPPPAPVAAGPRAGPGRRYRTISMDGASSDAGMLLSPTGSAFALGGSGGAKDAAAAAAAAAATTAMGHRPDDFFPAADEDEDESGDSMDDQEEYEEVHRDSLRARSGVGKIRSRRSGTRRRRNDPNAAEPVRQHIANAQSYYIDQDFEAANAECQQAIMVEPRADAAYRTLGLIAEVHHDYRRALTMYMIMAHLIPRDYDMWRRLAVFARQYGTEREQFHCYRKAMSAEPRDTLVPWKLINMYEAKGQLSPQVDLYRHLLRHLDHNMLLVRDVVRILGQKGGKNHRAEAADLWAGALAHHARGKFKHPWVPPTDSELREIVVPSSDTFLGRVHYTKRLAAAVEGVPATAENGACCVHDLYWAAELMLDLGRYARLAVLIKRVLRFLQGRHTEVWADDEAAGMPADDTEYDPVAFPRPPLEDGAPDGLSGMPLELRVMLGVCRLHLRQPDLAKLHFGVLRDHFSIEDHEELYDLMWQAYLDTNMYAEAIPVFDEALARLAASDAALTNNPPIEEPDTEEAAEAKAEADEDLRQLRQFTRSTLHFKRGQCLVRLGDLAGAIAEMEASLELNRTALEPREELANLYKLDGREHLAFELLTEAESLFDNRENDSVLFARRSDARGSRRRGGAGRYHDRAGAQSAAGEAEAVRGMGALLLDNERQPIKSERERLATRSTRKSALAAKEHEIRVKFDKLKLVGDRFDQLDNERRSNYLLTAASLFDTLRNTAAFYPSDRTVTFAGVDANGRIRNTKINKLRLVDEAEFHTVERRMFLAPRANYDPKDLEKYNQEKHKIAFANSYLGFSLDDWYEQLIRYCVALVKNHQSDRAFDVLHSMATANIFWHDNGKMLRMHVVGVSLAVASQRPSQAAQYCRWLINNHPYSANVYRVYTLAMSAGTRDRLAFASTNCQKFFKRTLLQRFAGPIRKHMTPAEVEAHGHHPAVPVHDEPELVWTAKPLLLTLYGHILSCAASYLPAVAHYLRAYALSPEDAMLNLSLGIAFLHRAMQRKSDNRHLQVAQGLAFLFRYAEFAKHPKTLVYYNLGRGFHQIGLMPLAVRYYRFALEGRDDERYLREVAYNLVLVYVHSNSPHLARRVMKEYLAV